MRPFTRRRIAALSAVGTVGVAVAAFAGVAPAYAADPFNGYDPGLTSDPWVKPCHYQSSSFCMFTSVDVGTGSGGNFPMVGTKEFLSDDGTPGSWWPVGDVFDENLMYDSAHNGPATGFVPGAVQHQWAPAMYQSDSSDTLWLYVPDVWDAANTASRSRIGVAKTGTYGEFNYIDYLKVKPGQTALAGDDYMSDPEVIPDGGGYGRIFWADHGGFASCGGIRQAPLDLDNLHYLGVGHGEAKLSFSGIGNAIPTTCANNTPYLEGPSVYYRHDFPQLWKDVPGDYMMVVAAQPDKAVPGECKTNGQPNKQTEVLAYFTASTAAQTTWQYGGLLMCGGPNDSTNQGSLVEVDGVTGKPHLLLYFHDSPSATYHQRRLQVACVAHSDIDVFGGHLALVPRDGDASCLNDDQNFFGLWSNDTPGDVGHLVTAPNAGSSALIVNRSALEEWEQFQFVGTTNPVNGSTVGLRSLANNKIVTTSGGQSPLIANRDALGSWESFTYTANGDGSFCLKAQVNSKWVVLSGQNLAAAGSSQSSCTHFTKMVY